MRAAPGTVRVVTSLGALDTAPLTYPEHGATRGPMPAGYHRLDWRATVGSGEATFRRAAEELLSWRMHAGAGLGVLATSHTAHPDAVVATSLSWRRVGLSMPCRVVYTVAEAHRQGFAYGTLPGHPVRGEEAFLVELTPGGQVRLTIRAFSRPARLLARLGGPAGRAVQRRVTARYMRALHRLASG